MHEGHRKMEFVLQPDGSVTREVSTFLGSGYVGTLGKRVADSVEQFRARFPGAPIANLIEREVMPLAPVDIRHKVASLSDAELAAMGLQRANATEPKGDRIPNDFPGDFALRRAGVTVEMLNVLTREDLTAIEGIGEKLADKILAARAERYPVVPTE